jgi:hypothetical protein
MAYVEWHQEIRNHWKTDDLMRRLSVPRREALGILGAITSWAIGHRPGGVIERKLIHVAVEWEKAPEPLLTALIDSGWLDVFDEERVEVHDWEDITQGYRKARKDAARKRKERKERQVESEKATKEKARNVRGRSTPKTVRGRSKERRSEQNEQNEQNERTRAGQPRSSVLQQPQNHPPSGSSAGRDTPGRDGSGPVVAVSDRNGGEDRGSPPSSTPKVDLQKQVSSRLAHPILEAIGVDGGIAEQLARSHPAVRILHVTEHAKKQDNPGGFARKALDQGWTVPDSNGAGLANLLAALEQEAAAKEARWQRMGGSSVAKKDPEFQRREGESEGEHFKRVNDLIQKRKQEGQK